jgi:hypothetical protein
MLFDDDKPMVHCHDSSVSKAIMLDRLKVGRAESLLSRTGKALVIASNADRSMRVPKFFARLKLCFATDHYIIVRNRNIMIVRLSGIPAAIAR